MCVYHNSTVDKASVEDGALKCVEERPFHGRADMNRCSAHLSTIYITLVLVYNNREHVKISERCRWRRHINFDVNYLQPETARMSESDGLQGFKFRSSPSLSYHMLFYSHRVA